MRLAYDHLPAIHEYQELQEARNVVAAGLGDELGVRIEPLTPQLTAVRTASMPLHAPGNQVFGFTPEHLGELDIVESWFDAVGSAVHLRAGADAVNRELADVLTARGYAAMNVEAWMVADLVELHIDAPVHDIRHVVDASGNDDFARAFCAGWQVDSRELERIVGAAMAPWPEPPRWHRFVAWVDGQPAAQALLVVGEHVGYLAEAATDPRFRRRGLQRALIAHRARIARELGCTQLFSQVTWGDASWANMRQLGLREGHMTVRYCRPPQDRS